MCHSEVDVDFQCILGLQSQSNDFTNAFAQADIPSGEPVSIEPPQCASRNMVFQVKRKPEWTIKKFKAQYCVRGDIQKRLSPKPLNLYYPVVQWATVKLMLIFQCILGLQSQSIDFTNAFAQADIPSWETVFIELPRYFKSDGGQHDVVLKLKKSLYGQAEAARLWYENLRNSLLEHGFVMRKVDTCLFMSKTVICVVYVYACLFWAHSQSNITGSL